MTLASCHRGVTQFKLCKIQHYNSEHGLLHFGTSNLWMLFIHSMRSATSILRQLHTPDESSIKHPFLPEPRFCMLVERFPRIFLSTRICVFSHFLPCHSLNNLSSCEPSLQLYSNFLAYGDFTFSQLPTSSHCWINPARTADAGRISTRIRTRRHVMEGRASLRK